MKKLLGFILVAILVAAFTAPALAAYPEFKYNGMYRVRIWYLNNQSLADDSDDEDKAAYWTHRFRFQPILNINEHLTIRGRFEAVKSNVWGTQGSSLNYAAPNRDKTTAVNNISAVDLARFWMIIKTGFGTFEIGRMITGTYGLAAMGYNVGFLIGDFTTGYVFNNMAERHGVYYTYKSGPLSLEFAFIKFEENDYNIAAYDQDQDQYSVLGTYKFAAGSFNVAVIYNRDRTDPTVDIDKWFVQPAAIVTFGPVTIHAEMQWLTGTQDPAGSGDSEDLGGLGLYFDVVYSYGPGWVRAGVMWVQAPDADDPTDLSKGQVTRGNWWLYTFMMPTPQNNYTQFSVAMEHEVNAMIKVGAAVHYLSLIHI